MSRKNRVGPVARELRENGFRKCRRKAKKLIRAIKQADNGELTLMDLAKRQGDEHYRTIAVALKRKSDMLKVLRE